MCSTELCKHHCSSTSGSTTKLANMPRVAFLGLQVRLRDCAIARLVDCAIARLLDSLIVGLFDRVGLENLGEPVVQA
eukprot:10076240-Lingulodinium_polyedra.AAC.1